MWKVEYYEDSNGRWPTKEFIDALGVKERAKVAWTLDLLEEFGISLGMPYAEHIEGQLWELRARLASSTFRLIYFLDTGNTFVVLHGFAEKTQKISSKDLQIVRNRLKDYQLHRRQ